MKKYLIALIVIALIAGVGYNYWKENKAGTEDGWKTYKNEKYGIGFNYPKNLKIVTDKVKYEYSNGLDWYRVELVDESAPERPSLRFEINPDGYGPFFPDKIYEITEKSDGGIKFSSYATEKDENNDDGGTLIVTKTMPNSFSKNTYSWHFSFKNGGIDYEPLFGKILLTFKFTK